MGADLVTLFYGVRVVVEVVDEETIEQLETETYPILAAAKREGLDTWYGSVEDHSSAYDYIVVGKKLALLSVQRLGESWTGYYGISLADLQAIATVTNEKLLMAGITETPMLHAELEPHLMPDFSKFGTFIPHTK